MAQAAKASWGSFTTAVGLGKSNRRGGDDSPPAGNEDATQAAQLDRRGSIRVRDDGGVAGSGLGPSDAPKPRRPKTADERAAENAVARGWALSDAEVKMIPEAERMTHLPDWVKYPGAERANWLNHYLRAFWPTLGRAVCEQAVAALEPLLNQVRPRALFESLRFEAFTLGPAPLVFAAVAGYATNEDEIILDVPVKWGGWGDHAVLAAETTWGLRPAAARAPGARGWTFRVLLSDVQFAATLRITLRPLLPALPCIGAVHLSLLEPLHFDCGLVLPGGLDLMAVPGVRQFVRWALLRRLLPRANLLWPKQHTVRLMKEAGLLARPPAVVHVLIQRFEAIDALRQHQAAMTGLTAQLKRRAKSPPRSGGAPLPPALTRGQAKAMDAELTCVRVGAVLGNGRRGAGGGVGAASGLDAILWGTPARCVTEGWSTAHLGGPVPSWDEWISLPLGDATSQILRLEVYDVAPPTGRGAAGGAARLPASVRPQAWGEVLAGSLPLYDHCTRRIGLVDAEGNDTGTSLWARFHVRPLGEPAPQLGGAPPADAAASREQRRRQEAAAAAADRVAPVDGLGYLGGRGLLIVKLVRGRELPSYDKNGLSDPLVRLSLAGQLYQSSIKAATLNPDWDETFWFLPVDAPSAGGGDSAAEELLVELFDNDVHLLSAATQDFMGRVRLPLGDVVDNRRVGGSYPLQDSRGGKGTASLTLEAEWCPFRPSA